MLKCSSGAVSELSRGCFGAVSGLFRSFSAPEARQRLAQPFTAGAASNLNPECRRHDRSHRYVRVITEFASKHVYR